MAGEKPKAEKPMFKSQEEAEARVKDLQRQLQTARNQAKESAVGRIELDTLSSQVKDLGEMMRLSLDRDAGADDTEERLTKLKGRGTEIEAAAKARREISEALVEAGEEWSDPQYDPARQLYDAGKLDEAVKAVKTRLEGLGRADNSVDDRVAAEVSRRLAERGMVDHGDSVAAGGLPTDLAEMRTRLDDRTPAGVQWRKEHHKELMDAVRKGELGSLPAVHTRP